MTAYRTLADELRQALARGDHADGRALPTEEDLAHAYGVSRGTVRRGIQELVAEGLVYRVRGRGTFATGVAPTENHFRSFGSVEDLIEDASGTEMETLEALHERWDPAAAARLGLHGENHVWVASTRRIDGETVKSVTRLIFPAEIGSRLAELGLFLRCGERLGRTAIGEIDARIRPVAGARQSIEAVALPASAADALRAAPDVPALQIERLYHDNEERPVEFAQTWFEPGRYRYTIRLSRRISV